MDEMKILIRAKNYAMSMSEGINPLNGEFAPEGDTISNERIKKYMSYVADVFDTLIKNGGIIAEPKKRKLQLSGEQKNRIILSDKPIGVNDMARRINSVKEKNMTGIPGARISSWLVKAGYLDAKEYPVTSTKTKKILNSRSAELGLEIKNIVNDITGEEAEMIMCSKKAQEFIVKNIENMYERNR